jgi:hypothetical protein
VRALRAEQDAHLIHPTATLGPAGTARLAARHAGGRGASLHPLGGARDLQPLGGVAGLHPLDGLAHRAHRHADALAPPPPVPLPPQGQYHFIDVRRRGCSNTARHRVR